MKINGRPIGLDYAPYIVAEMSANHNGSLNSAIELIDAAAKAGADAVKIQSYRPDTITLDVHSEEFTIRGGLWDGRTLFELYEEAHTPWDWHPQLFEHASKRGITIFSSPFDHSAIDFLESLRCPAYKIASFEAVDLPLIEHAASTGKPLIISTGMADANEINDACEAALSAGCMELALLHCVSGYPAPAEDYNLLTIPDMRERFNCEIGLSDHTLENASAIASVALGATIIEKHFSLDRERGGPDDAFSIEPAELKRLKEDSMTAWSALGRINYEQKASEKSNLKFRRSLYFTEDLKAGDIITAENIRSVRPGYGISPARLKDVIGRQVVQDISKNTPVSDKHFR